MCLRVRRRLCDPMRRACQRPTCPSYAPMRRACPRPTCPSYAPRHRACPRPTCPSYAPRRRACLGARRPSWRHRHGTTRRRRILRVSRWKRWMPSRRTSRRLCRSSGVADGHARMRRCRRCVAGRAGRRAGRSRRSGSWSAYWIRRRGSWRIPRGSGGASGIALRRWTGGVVSERCMASRMSRRAMR